MVCGYEKGVHVTVDEMTVTIHSRGMLMVVSNPRYNMYEESIDSSTADLANMRNSPLFEVQDMRSSSTGVAREVMRLLATTAEPEPAPVHPAVRPAR